MPEPEDGEADVDLTEDGFTEADDEPILLDD